MEPVLNERLSFSVNEFALVSASVTFPFKTIFPVKVGLTFGAYVTLLPLLSPKDRVPPNYLTDFSLTSIGRIDTVPFGYVNYLLF